MTKEEITELREKGYTYRKIGEIFGVSHQRVHQKMTGWKPRKMVPQTLEYLEKQKEIAIKRQLFIQGKIDQIKEVIARREERKVVRRDNIQKLIKKSIEDYQTISSLTGFKNGGRDRRRELVRLRDNHTCQECGKVWQPGKRRFDVHHLDEELDGKTFKLPLSEVDKNTERMITLCHKCHLNLPETIEKMSAGQRNLNRLKLST